MPVSYSYPGIYVEELPLSAQTITPAPTSIAVFVGYTHPWNTPAFNTAIQLFSFTDYEVNFGGLYTSSDVPSDVARAVYEFFQNGGTNAHVVGLQANAYDANNNNVGIFGPPPTGTLCAQATIPPHATTVGLQVTALQPTDVVPMTVRVTNIRTSYSATVYDTFDLVVTYGTHVETYRNLGIGVSPSTGTNLPQARSTPSRR